MQKINSEKFPITNDDRILKVSNALRELNRFLNPDRQIKMILFFYSKFSEKSDMLIRHLPQECRPYFHYICIDSKSIREKISRSSTVKISEVPSIVVIDVNDMIFTYEGDSTVDFIKNIQKIVISYELSKHGPNCQCPVHKKESPIVPEPQQKRSTVTPLSAVIEEDEYPQESKRLPKNTPFRNFSSHKTEVIEDDIDEQEDIVEEPKIRTKIRTINRPIDNNIIIKEQDLPSGGLSSVRHLPPKGVGHDKMATSSLSQIDYPKEKNTQRDNRQQKRQSSQSVDQMIDEDELEELLDEDPTIDPGIRNNSSSGKKVDKKEAMDSVKKVAVEMQRMREMELENSSGM